MLDDVGHRVVIQERAMDRNEDAADHYVDEIAETLAKRCAANRL
jgi:hypothetical protein